MVILHLDLHYIKPHGRIICHTEGNQSNICCIWITFFQPFRTVGNLIIVNLAVADFAVTGFVNPFSIVGNYVLKTNMINTWKHMKTYIQVKSTLCKNKIDVCLTTLVKRILYQFFNITIATRNEFLILVFMPISMDTEYLVFQCKQF